MKLAQAAQTFLCFIEQAQMAAEAELEAKRRQPAVFAQCPVGPWQPRLIATGRQMREGLRLDKEKCVRVARAQPHRLLCDENRLVGSIEKHQNQRAMREGQGEIWIENNRGDQSHSTLHRSRPRETRAQSRQL